MPLDIHVDADVNGLRDTARWMHRVGSHANDAGGDIRGARADAEADWGGRSGRAFQEFMGRFGEKADAFRDGAQKVGGGIDQYADAMNHVKSRMDQARGVAAKAGLATSEARIAEPGPAPPGPGSLPPNASPQQTHAHAAAVQAHSEHQAKVKAYNEARQTVVEARRAEKRAQSILLDLLGGGPVKIGLTMTDVTSGLAGSAIAATEKYRNAATRFASKAEQAAGRAADASLSAEQRASALIDKCVANAKSTVAQEAATGTVPRRMLDKIPERAKTSLGELDGVIKVGGRLGKFAEPVLKRVPIVGVAATGAGIIYDISQGEDPTKAVASGVSSLAAGAAVGACIGGPVGVVVGAAVGAGVGYVVDHWGDDIAHGVEDAFDWATSWF